MIDARDAEKTAPAKVTYIAKSEGGVLSTIKEYPKNAPAAMLVATNVLINEIL